LDNPDCGFGEARIDAGGAHFDAGFQEAGSGGAVLEEPNAALGS